MVEIAVSATSGNETSRRYEWLGPSPVDDTGVEGAPLPGIPSAGLADVYEPAYGACGAFVASPNGASPSNKTLRTCYLGDEHSTGRVPDLPETRRRPRARDGRGCAGQVSSGAERPSLPLRVRGHPQARGSPASAAPPSDGGDADADVFFAAAPDDPANFDFEACDALLNADEVAGNVCVTARGSCFFSQKTLACQAAGAVAAVIVNTDFAEGAVDAWGARTRPRRSPSRRCDRGRPPLTRCCGT